MVLDPVMVAIMQGKTPEDSVRSPRFAARLYGELLRETKVLADKALDRLRTLHQRFPASIPSAFLDQLDRLRADPHERRKATRLNELPLAATVRFAADPCAREEAVVVDRCPGGLALRLSQPAPAGAHLGGRYRRVDDVPAWLLVQVKHCHRDGDGWFLGCELIGEPLLS